MKQKRKSNKNETKEQENNEMGVKYLKKKPTITQNTEYLMIQKSGCFSIKTSVFILFLKI